MNLKNEILFILLISYLSLNQSKLILVEYNEVSDTIFYNRRIFKSNLDRAQRKLHTEEPSSHASGEQVHSIDIKEEKTKHSKGEEELTNSEFWFYALFSLCNIILI